MTDSQIKQLIDTFLDKRKPQTRYTSFDYCFNYFRSFKQSGRLRELVAKENVEKSCLQLAFFLASWGMFRMSGKLGQEVNAKHFLRLIDEISMWDGSHACASIWDIDVPDYEKPETRAFLKDCYEQIKELALLPGQKQHQ